MSVAKTKPPLSISRCLITFLSFGLFAYFSYHLLHGDHGYFAWKGVQEKMKTAEAVLDKTKAERETLEKNVRMLRPDSLDLDLLDERARVVLGFVKAEERVVVDKVL